MAKSEPTSGTDTVTPLETTGAGAPVESASVSETPARVARNVSREDYTTQGKTVVATRRGYEFVPGDKKIPVIDSAGIHVTKSEADDLVAESGGLVHIKNEED